VDREPMLERKKDRKVYGFARGDTGYFLVNLRNEDYSDSIQTGLPEGLYCDYFSSGAQIGEERCQGGTYEIDAAGFLVTPVPGSTALAITVKEKIE